MGVADGARYSLGDVTLEFRHTPGHTPESMSIVVYQHASDDVPYGVLTGDTLFIGDVGRPDLLASIGFTRDELADKLYDSFARQADDTVPTKRGVFPAHGAGSACGKNLSTDLWSTIGDQKATNYALRAPDKASFVALVTEGQPPAPSYFGYDAMLNRQDRELLDEAEMPAAMTYDQVRAAVDGGAVLVDGRTPEEFRPGALRQAINIGLEGRYAEFAGSVLQSDVDIVLLTEPGQELEGKNRLARIGFDRVVGYLADPYQVMFAHQDDVRVASRLTAKAFDERTAQMADLQVVDVRNPGEVAGGTIPNAIIIPVGQLPTRLASSTHEADGRLLCWWVPVVGRGKPAAAQRILRRERYPWRLQRLGRRDPERLSDTNHRDPAKHQTAIVGGGSAGISSRPAGSARATPTSRVIELSDTHHHQVGDRPSTIASHNTATHRRRTPGLGVHNAIESAADHGVFLFLHDPVAALPR